jgi:hypothetical protein
MRTTEKKIPQTDPAIKIARQRTVVAEVTK